MKYLLTAIDVANKILNKESTTDGTLERIVRPDTEKSTYTHVYSAPGEYIIGFG